jgi:transcription elongation factor Elf1
MTNSRENTRKGEKMKCTNCGHEEIRKCTISAPNGYIHYLQCKNCEHVVGEAPEHIPNEQKERYLERIKKGKDGK